MQALRSTVDVLRDRLAPISHTSTFRSTGQITPEEFVAAGDYLVYKFPSWSWSAAASPAKAVSYLPSAKQYLVTRGVPCHRRLDANFAGDGEDTVIRGGEGFDVEGEGEGWLSAGGDAGQNPLAQERDVKSLGDKGEIEADQEEEDIPDMDDDGDDDAEAIISERGGGSPLRTYNLYITYTPYYRTPRLYLSGYTRAGPSSTSVPLAPSQMLEDIAGDYKDKTVTLEDFPFFDTPVKTASVHPCKHAAVMKVLLDRADAALKLRRDKLKAAQKKGDAPSKAVQGTQGLEGLVDDTNTLSLGQEGMAAGARAGAAAAAADDWEMLQRDDTEDEVAIRVDQYVVVFLKFMASVTPGIEHDFTMGV